MNIHNQIRSVVFDADGTLFDTLPSLAAAANEVLTKAGMSPIAPVLLRPALNTGLLPMFRQGLALQAHQVETEEATHLEGRFLAHYVTQWLPKATLFPGAADALAEFKAQGLKIAICTNRDRASAERLLASAGISGCIDVIVGIGDAARPKPAPDPLLVVLNRLGANAKDALFIGDSSMDASCAMRAEVRFAAHLNGYADQPSDLLPNVFTFGDYALLTRWVLDRLTSTKETCHA